MRSPQIEPLAVLATESQVSREPAATKPGAIDRTEVELTTEHHIGQAAERLGLSTDQQLMPRTPFRREAAWLISIERVARAEVLRGSMQMRKAERR